MRIRNLMVKYGAITLITVILGISLALQIKPAILRHMKAEI